MESLVDVVHVKLILEYLKRYAVVVLVFAAMGVGGSVLYNNFLKSETFVSGSKILVNRDAGNSVSQQYTAMMADADVIQTYDDIINSYAILSVATKQLKQSDDTMFSDLSASELAKTIKINHKGKSQVFSIQATTESKEKSIKSVNAVAEAFSKKIGKIMSVSEVSILTRGETSVSKGGMSDKLILLLGAVIGGTLEFLLSVGLEVRRVLKK